MRCNEDCTPTCVQAHLDKAEQALVAEAVSPFGARVLEMDASLELGLLVCGDRWGNVAAFSMPNEALSCPGGVPTRPRHLAQHSTPAAGACMSSSSKTRVLG